jgi:hypothetical protein
MRSKILFKFTRQLLRRNLIRQSSTAFASANRPALPRESHCRYQSIRSRRVVMCAR